MIIHGLEIESGVELVPSESQNMAKKMTEVAKAMKVGDSVMVPSSMDGLNHLKQALWDIGYQCEFRPEGTSGTRVWRTG